MKPHGKFRRLPLVVDAWRITSAKSAHCPAWVTDVFGCGRVSWHPLGLAIETLEGQMIGRHGDYLIRGVEGELYPCKPSIFQKTYQEAP